MNVQFNQGTTQSSVSQISQTNVASDQMSAIKNQRPMEMQTEKQEMKETENSTVSFEDLQEQVDGMNKLLEANFTALKFNVHEQLARVYVQVINRDTDEVVREIPPEKFLDMLASMLEFVGLLIDKKV